MSAVAAKARQPLNCAVVWWRGWCDGDEWCSWVDVKLFRRVGLCIDREGACGVGAANLHMD